MYILKTNTAYRMPVGPLVDPGDGKTAETSLTVTDLSVQLYQMKNDGSAVVRTQFTPTASGGNNDMALVASSTDAMYDLEITAAQINWMGNGRISFYDVDGFLIHWIDIQVVSAAYYDWVFGTTIPEVNLKQILGTALTETAGLIAAGFKKFFNVATPTGTVNSLPDAVAGANGGLPTTDGTKVSQTVDLTTGQSIACSDKTGFSLSATGADLILKSSTFIQAIVAAINELATYGLTALNTLLVTTGIKTATTAAPTDMALNSTVAKEATLGAVVEYLDTEIAEILADTNELQLDWANGGRLDTILDAAGSAGDPWSTELPGAYGAGTAGKIVGDNIDAKISSRSNHSAADVWAATGRTLSSFGTLIVDIVSAVWEAATRTLSTFDFSLGFATPTNVIDARDYIVERLPADLSGIATLAGQEAILAAIALISGGVGTGPIPKPYTLTVDGIPCADVLVIMSTDELGVNAIHAGRTNALGQITFYPDLPAGTTIYLWRYKTGVTFVNPDEEQI